jgi:hypothetical protein
MGNGILQNTFSKKGPAQKVFPCEVFQRLGLRLGFSPYVLRFPTGSTSLRVFARFPTSSGKAVGDFGEIFQAFGGGGLGLATGNLAGCLIVLVPRVSRGNARGLAQRPDFRLLPFGFFLDS